ncbi:MAG: hypothetical protein ACUVWK_04690 [Nitrososphaerales archaeon]
MGHLKKFVNIPPEKHYLWIRMMSLYPYNPCKASLDKISEDEGVIVAQCGISITRSLFDKSLEKVKILDIPVGESRLLLERGTDPILLEGEGLPWEGRLWLIFHHIHPQIGWQAAKIDIEYMKSARELLIKAFWSKDTIRLHVDDVDGNLPSKESEGKIIAKNFSRSKKDDSWLVIGGETDTDGQEWRHVFAKRGEIINIMRKYVKYGKIIVQSF